MNKVYIVAAKRTAIGSFLGTLSQVHPADLGAAVVKDLLNTSQLNPDKVDEVIVGNVLPAGQGQGLARQVAVKGGIPVKVPAYGVNMVCGSGMKAVMNAYTSIALGLSNVIIAGGAEAMSSAPFLLPQNIRSGNKLGHMTMNDSILADALTDAFEGFHMGITAENIADRYGISREEQDAFAYESQKRAIKAVDEGKFIDEITPLEVRIRRDTVTFDQDEYPNRTTNLEKLAKLRTVFKKDGTVTAGNASGINDGASMMLLVSESALKELELEPLAEIIAIGQGGVEPEVMGLGPIPAIDSALKQAGMTLSDMSLIELNEAFAAQSLGVIKQLSQDWSLDEEALLERTNVNGGAIALGHPVGVSGNRIMVTLIHELIKQKKSYGLASLCIGGGMGTAVIIKQVRWCVYEACKIEQ